MMNQKGVLDAFAAQVILAFGALVKIANNLLPTSAARNIMTDGFDTWNGLRKSLVCREKSLSRQDEKRMRPIVDHGSTHFTSFAQIVVGADGAFIANSSNLQLTIITESWMQEDLLSLLSDFQLQI
jgi:hypothetical protein